MPRKPIVFLSYAHADEPEHPAEGEVKWLSYVTGFLRPAIKNGEIDLWVDTLLRGGDAFDAEIKRKLAECDLLVLLLSNASTSSDYVIDEELRLARERQIPIFPLLLKPVTKAGLSHVNDLVLRPKDAKPLSSFPLHERMEKMVAAADEMVEGAVEAMSRSKGREVERFVFRDRETLQKWLLTQRHEVSVVLAARAALRVLPAFAEWPRRAALVPNAQRFADLTFALFFATALARFVAASPTRGGGLYAVAHAAAYAAAQASSRAEISRDADYFRATPRIDAIAAAAASNAANAAGRTDAAVYAAATANHAGRAAPDEDMWGALSADVEVVAARGVTHLTKMPLWRGEVTPYWAREHLRALRKELSQDRPSNWFRRATPPSDDWQVWFDWYDDILAGRWRGEARELVFASVPEAERKAGAAASNAWIRAQLDKLAASGAKDEAPPQPLADAPTPVVYGWQASPDAETLRRIAAIAGAQNLPFYENFAAEQDHQTQLDLCRRNASKLLEQIDRERRANTIPRDYEPVLRDYLDVLPPTAGAGSVALAYDETRMLQGLFSRDAGQLPNSFAARLARLIENQLALNAFYDWPRRHEKAVAEGSWGKAAFPEDAARVWREAIRARTPSLFDPNVAPELDRIAAAEPPPAPTEPLPASVVPPTALPANAPDAKKSLQYQSAAAANALWATFLKGKDFAAAVDGWHKAAQELGPLVKPLIEFLRDLAS